MSKEFILVFIIISTICFHSCTQSKGTENKESSTTTITEITDSTDQHPEWDAYFNKLVKENEFNGALLIAKKNTILYQNAYGIANKKTKENLSTQHRFQLASVSKQFTAAAIMLLVQDSLIDLQANVKKYIPEFPYENITIELLLTHRSGLPNYMYFTETTTNRKTTIYNEDVIKLMVKHKPKKYLNPDVQYNYNNSNYVVLATVIERISGKSYSEFMNERFFKPLGMKNTYVYVKEKNEPSEKTAIGYHYRWEEAYHTYQEGVTGDKGIYSTLEDMLRWDLSLQNADILKSETIGLMYKPKNSDLKYTNYGYGWRIPMFPPYKETVFHSGWYRGFNAIYGRDLNNGYCIILLSNIRTKNLMSYYKEILYELYNKEEI